MTVMQKDDQRDIYSNLWDRPGFLVRRLHQIHISLFYDEYSEEKITPVQYGLLSILANLPCIDQMTLSAELGIDRTNVGDVVRRLESRGLVLRLSNPDDGRARLVSITKKGLGFLRRTHSAMQHTQDRLLAPLPEQDRLLFLDLLRRLVEANNDLGRTSLRPNFGRLPAKAVSAVGSLEQDANPSGNGTGRFEK